MTTILRQDWDREKEFPHAADVLIRRLREELEYAYRCVERGFKYGDFDFSILRKRAQDAVEKMDEIDGPAF